MFKHTLRHSTLFWVDFNYTRGLIVAVTERGARRGTCAVNDF